MHMNPTIGRRWMARSLPIPASIAIRELLIRCPRDLILPGIRQEERDEILWEMARPAVISAIKLF